MSPSQVFYLPELEELSARRKNLRRLKRKMRVGAYTLTEQRTIARIVSEVLFDDRGMPQLSERRSSTDARPGLLPENLAAVVGILKLVAATGFSLPRSLRRPSTRYVQPEAWAAYRSALEGLGGMIEAAFLAEHLAARPAREVIDDHVARVRNLANDLTEALDAPLAAGLRFNIEMVSGMPSGGLTLAGLNLQLALLKTVTGEVLQNSNKSNRLNAQDRHPARSWSRPADERITMLERVFRECLVRDPTWEPKLQNSKKTGFDPFTVFAVAVHAAKGDPLKPLSFQTIYRRARSQTNSKK